MANFEPRLLWRPLHVGFHLVATTSLSIGFRQPDHKLEHADVLHSSLSF